MAKPISQVESHIQRQRIIEAIASNRPLTEIAAWTDPPLSRAILNRFKSRAIAIHDENFRAAKRAIATQCSDQPSNSNQAIQKMALALAIDPFTQRCVQHQETIDAALVKAKAGEGRDTIATLIGVDLRGLELYAKLAGRLDAGTHIQVSVVVPGTASTPAEPEGMVIDIKAG